VGTHPKIAILKQFQTHFKAKREKGAGTPFAGVPIPLHPRLLDDKNCFCSMMS